LVKIQSCYEEDDDDDDDDDENDEIGADDYIAVDEQGISSGGLVIKLEDAVYVGTDDFEVDTVRATGGQHAGVQDDNDVAESFFDGADGLPMVYGGRWRPTGGSLQRLVGSGRRSLLDGCCWYGPVTLRCFAACIRSRPFLFFIYVVLSLVLLSSCVSMVLVSTLVARPYVRVSGFINTTCTRYGRGHIATTRDGLTFRCPHKSFITIVVVSVV